MKTPLHFEKRIRQSFRRSLIGCRICLTWHCQWPRVALSSDMTDIPCNRPLSVCILRAPQTEQGLGRPMTRTFLLIVSTSLNADTHGPTWRVVYLIFCYKVVFGLIPVPFTGFLKISCKCKSNIRNHKYKLYKPQSACNVRQNFLT